MITTDKVIEIFCIADDFCAEYENGRVKQQVQFTLIVCKTQLWVC